MSDLVAFGIILDDLVFPNGRTAMGVLGGGGPQTAFGMRLPALAGWIESSCQVGLVAGIGRDLPDSAWAWLRAAGIDLAGVRVSDLPTLRAWQLLEADGRRTQVWRVKSEALGAQLGRSSESLPESCRSAMGFHLGTHPDEPDLEFIRQLRRLSLRGAGRPRDKGKVRELSWTKLRGGPIISLELFKPADRPPSDEALRRLCSAADTLSPNLAEARSLAGNGSPDELAHRLADAGAPIVALRMGPEGSLVYDSLCATHLRSASHLALIHVPAVPTMVVDPTGAGNAYCGAFLAGYVHTSDVLTAARYGAVAASFLVEQVGLPAMDDQLPIAANLRLRALEQAGQ